MNNNDFSQIRTAVIEEIVHLARKTYVYPEIGEEIASQIMIDLNNGAYDDISSETELAMRLTGDLRKLSNDHHWSVSYDPHGDAGHVDPENENEEERLASYLEMVRKKNYGFERVERLKGNIGYIDIRLFIPSEYGGETAVAAMNFVANCDALIIDIRKNDGGYPSMVQLVTSYLVDKEAQHINTFFYRPTGDTQQFWTFPHIPGKRCPDIPVYILISGATSSGAEEFAYNLKHMDRATLIGETTAGMAHPVTKEIVKDSFDVRLPYGRPINPVTGTNWEGKGVEPHISVPEFEALQNAHLAALTHLQKTSLDKTDQEYYAWIAEMIAADYSPVILDTDHLRQFAGEYGKLKFFIEDGRMFYEHQALSEAWEIIPISSNRFRLDEDMKFEFSLDEKGKKSIVKVFFADGRAAKTYHQTD